MCRNTTARPVLGSPPDGHTHLSADLLLSQYGVNGTLDEAGLQEAFAAIISCQVRPPNAHLTQMVCFCNLVTLTA